MPESDDDDRPAGKRICHTCVKEAFISNVIKSAGKTSGCDYCGVTAPSVTIEELADRIEQAFDEHYTRTPSQPDSWQERMMADRESRYVWEREGARAADAIQDAAGIEEAPAADVLEILQVRHGDFDAAAMGEECEFDDDAHYEEIGPDNQAWHEEWNDFEHSIKTNARFFSPTAVEHLAAVFGGIDKLRTHDKRPLVVEAGPGTALEHLYRARVFQNDDKLQEALCRPDLHLGSPPRNAARAGRMNAQGISVFYGATNESVAVAEVRPPVGSKVAVAKFAITRKLRLLDLTALEDAHDTGSIFDPSLKHRLERVGFLRTLGGRMASPVMPDDEAVEYLPTQAVADFLATMNEPRLDGIIFPSAQTKDGRNVVLLHRAARVEPLTLPEGTKIEASTGYGTDEGWEVDYSVHETVPAVKPSVLTDPHDGFPGIVARHLATPPRHDDDVREPALRVDATSVMVHQVARVEVNTTPFSVHRHRSAERKPKF